MENPILKTVAIGSHTCVELLRPISAEDVDVTATEPHEYYSPDEAREQQRIWQITAHVGVALKPEVFDHFIAAFGLQTRITQDAPNPRRDTRKEGQRGWTINGPLDSLSIDPWIAEPGERRYTVKFERSAKVLRSKYEAGVAQARADMPARIESEKPGCVNAALDDFNTVLERLLHRHDCEFDNYLMTVVVNVGVSPAWLRNQLRLEGGDVMLLATADNERYQMLVAEIADLEAQRDEIDKALYRQQRGLVERYIIAADPIMGKRIERLAEYTQPTRDRLFGRGGKSRSSIDIWDFSAANTGEDEGDG